MVLNPMAPSAMTQMGGDVPIWDLFKSMVGTPGKPHAKPGETWSRATDPGRVPDRQRVAADGLHVGGRAG